MNSPIVKRVQSMVDMADKRSSYLVFSRSQRLMPRLKTFLVSLEWSGNGLIWIASTIIFLVCLPKQSSMIPKLLIGLMMDIFSVAILKAIARRRRPTYAYQRDQMIVASVDKHSFPSGHCSRATYVAFFARHYFAHSSPFFTFMVSIWSASVCTSRVLLGRHHILDCVAGATLGWLTYTIQFYSLLPVNLIGMVLLRGVFGQAFSDPNDIDGSDAFE